MPFPPITVLQEGVSKPSYKQFMLRESNTGQFCWASLERNYSGGRKKCVAVGRCCPIHEDLPQEQ